jgi:anti-sigma regulatory factor (Ser/Thr protein kinase)
MDKIIDVNRINVHHAELDAKDLAEKLNFKAKQCEEIRLIAAELADNVLKHSSRGTIQINAEDEYIEIISKNRGDLTGKDFIDGSSSKGTLGIGLGMIGRLSDEVSYETHDGWVEIKAIKFHSSFSSNPKKIETAALSHGLMGGRANGDEFLSIRRSNSLFLALIDVLGHGRAAHEIAIEVKRFLEDQHYLKLDEIMNNLHDHLRGDRGAMVELMRLDLNKKILEFCGVGDVSCRIYSGNDKRSIPIFTVDGIVGETLRKTNLQRLELPEDAVIAMFSDGISQSFDIPIGLRKVSSVRLVHELMQKYGKSHDDRTLLITKIGS